MGYRSYGRALASAWHAVCEAVGLVLGILLGLEPGLHR